MSACVRACLCACVRACVHAHVHACVHACTMYVKAFGKGIFGPIHVIWYLAHMHNIKKKAKMMERYDHSYVFLFYFQ